jgi:hypothetical protein
VGLPHICIDSPDQEIDGEYADDLRRSAVDDERRAERAGRAPESRLPEAMTDHDHPLPLFGFVGRKAAPQHGPDTEERQQVGGDTRADDLFRPVCSSQRRGHGIEGGHVHEALALTAPLFDIPKGRSALAKVLRRILGPQHRQLFGRAIWKRPEQNRIHDAEHRGVGANRQRQCSCRGRRKSGTLAERARRVAEILARLVEPGPDPDPARVLLRQRDVAKREHRPTAGLLRRQASCNVVLGFGLDVITDVVLEIIQRTPAPAGEEWSASFSRHSRRTIGPPT